MSRPAQIRFLSRVAGAYDAVARLLGFVPLWRAVAQVAAPHRREPTLDVCTGTGGAAWELAQRGAWVVGVDAAAGMLQCAQHKHNGHGHNASPHFARMDARALAFRDHSFPVVTCAMALHEMAEAERDQVLREIGRVASERIVIAEYRVPQPPRRQLFFRATRCFEYAESDDFASFVRRDFNERLEHAGFWVGRPRDVGAYRIWPCHVRHCT